MNKEHFNVMQINDKQKPHLLLANCIVFLLVTLFVNGCATPSVKPIEKVDYPTKLQFLIDGKTTRKEVLLTLGEPSGVFEADRILTYIISIDDKAMLHVIPRQMALFREDPRLYSLNRQWFSLVLVFGKDNVLEKYSLVGSKD